MKPIAFNQALDLSSVSEVKFSQYLYMFLAGSLGVLGFAPFHLPGFTIISLACLFNTLIKTQLKQSFFLGFAYGMGYFGLGVSWVINSIHDYGQLNYFFAGLATLGFVMFMSLYPALTSALFSFLKKNDNRLLNLGTFSVLWCLCEFVRANIMTGFPWLLIGHSQIDTPLRNLAPIIGPYGLSFCCALAATLLTYAFLEKSIKRNYFLIAFVLLIITPSVFKNIKWTTVKEEPITIAGVQANLSMRNKWNEHLFWDLLKYYDQATDKLLGKKLIIWPESAIPIPASYLDDYLVKLNSKLLKANSALILGIIQPTDDTEKFFFNEVITMGHANGQHIKYELVPFGEYIPKPFVSLNKMLGLPMPVISPGELNQPLIKIFNYPIATLICYEIAYPLVLRQQMPQAQWIVSISDNGWFGKSLASFQQQQMSQMLSLLTGRYQVTVNNDGLSSVINESGEIVESLPAFSAGTLQSQIYPAEGTTPWIIWGDKPCLIICSLYLIFILLMRFRRVS